MDRFPKEIGAARPFIHIVAGPGGTRPGRRARPPGPAALGAWRRATFCRAFAARSLSISSLHSANGWAPTIILTSLTLLPSLTPSSRVGVPVIPSYWPTAMPLLTLSAYLPLSRHFLKGSTLSPMAWASSVSSSTVSIDRTRGGATRAS